MAKSEFISQLSESIQSELNDYMNATIEIYGIISMEKLVEIINSQNDYVVTTDDLKYVGFKKRV
ncbi:MAG: hypothetical protein A2Y17_07445 [Clostridiales bacterium GWF2_38_85]|nr:MAG: hypothetical protein A2Y17_07445 [Clostridiales bacterium GWF2_38_85]HBL84292.1 hypothetical protein [Clostridiales bacterium]